MHGSFSGSRESFPKQERCDDRVGEARPAARGGSPLYVIQAAPAAQARTTPQDSEGLHAISECLSMAALLEKIASALTPAAGAWSSCRLFSTARTSHHRMQRKVAESRPRHLLQHTDDGLGADRSQRCSRDGMDERPGHVANGTSDRQKGLNGRVSASSTRLMRRHCRGSAPAGGAAERPARRRAGYRPSSADAADQRTPDGVLQRRCGPADQRRPAGVAQMNITRPRERASAFHPLLVQHRKSVAAARDKQNRGRSAVGPQHRSSDRWCAAKQSWQDGRSSVPTGRDRPIAPPAPARTRRLSRRDSGGARLRNGQSRERGRRRGRRRGPARLCVRIMGTSKEGQASTPAASVTPFDQAADRHRHGFAAPAQSRPPGRALKSRQQGVRCRARGKIGWPRAVARR